MLKNLVLVAGTVVFAVGCAEMSQDEATEALDEPVVTEAPEVPVVVDATEVLDAAEAPGAMQEPVVPDLGNARRRMNLNPFT